MAADALAMKRIQVPFEALAAALEALIAAAISASPITFDRSTLAKMVSLPRWDREAEIDGTYRARVQGWRGFQTCPWSAPLSPPWSRPNYAQCAGWEVRYSSVDWRVENLRTGQMMDGPGLIIHLMRDHHFCEGVESPYRVDPVALAQLLELA